METLDTQLQELLRAHQDHFCVTDNGKIQCTLNGHTLPPRLDALSSFLQGAKFQKLSKRAAADKALQKYEPFIIPSKNFPLMLYCALTGQLIERSLDGVKKHMKGKKFQRAKDRFAADELELKPEPSLESFGIKVKPAEQQEQHEQQQQQPAVQKASKAPHDEPGFWAPSSDEGSGAEDGSDDEPEAGSSGSSEEGDDIAGDPMDEDEENTAPPDTTIQLPASNGSKSVANGRAKHKQAAASKPTIASNGTAVAVVKKRNAQRPSAAKKAKH